MAMNDPHETFRSALQAAEEGASIAEHANEREKPPAPVPASHSPIREGGEHARSEAEAGQRDASADDIARRKRSRRAALEPLLNWLADRILDQLLEEQRAEIERSRNKHPEAGKTS